MTSGSHQEDPGTLDIEELSREIASRARARIDNGEYPPTLDADLDYHYRAIVASRNPGTSLHHQLLSRFDAATADTTDSQVLRLRDGVRAALLLLADELPTGRGSMPERIDDLLDRIVAMERTLGSGPESMKLLLDRIRRLEDTVAAPRDER